MTPRTPEGPTWQDVIELVTRLDAADYADVEIEMPGLHLRMSTSPTAFDDAPGTTAQATTTPAVPATAPRARPAEPAPPSGPETSEPDTGLVAVAAPMLGTFYRRPSPDAEPFVQVGAEVSADTTVGIIEVMKLMNPVSAGVAGRVAEICAQDGDLVEHEQPLLRIDPGGQK
ncbi:acetyl-CoA carboxylase [Spirillospora sp. NBC_00431]